MIENLKQRHDQLSELLMECEAREVRLREISNRLFSEMDENKKQKLKIEIAIQGNIELIQQTNLS